MSPTPLSDFDYDLPPELIAQEPAPVRDRARLLHLDRTSGDRWDLHVSDLPDRLLPGDLVVVNDTRVFPARLLGHREPSGGRVECLLLARLDDTRWDVLVHPGQKLKEGARARFGEGDRVVNLEVLERRFHGRRLVTLTPEGTDDIEVVIDAIGHPPLPPYIKRSAGPRDHERYQTMFARVRGSVAAPTAGLHFTPDVMRRLSARGIETVAITLHVGYGTFQPIRTDDIEAHRVAAEHVEISPASAKVINAALDRGRRIVAVGTTTTRALESAARASEGRVAPGRDETDLYIKPGHEFRVVRGLVTNFHLPRSSLLVLVAAFAGRDTILSAYREAVAHRYRFYSYGDAMLIT